MGTASTAMALAERLFVLADMTITAGSAETEGDVRWDAVSTPRTLRVCEHLALLSHLWRPGKVEGQKRGGCKRAVRRL